MRNRFSLFFLLFLFFLTFLSWQILYYLFPHTLRADFFDVGEGESFFVRTPYGKTILFNGGPNSVILRKVSKEIPFWQRTIDMVVITRLSHGQIGGLFDILRSYKVKNVLIPFRLGSSLESKGLLRLISQKAENIIIAREGERIILGNVSLEVIYSSPYSSSILVRVSFGNNSFLLANSLQKRDIKAVLSRKRNVEAEILEVPAGGAKNVTSEDFLEAVGARAAIISLGEKREAAGKHCDNKKRNRYGHPSCSLLSRLKKYGIKVLRTDEEGDIAILANGLQYQFVKEN